MWIPYPFLSETAAVVQLRMHSLLHPYPGLKTIKEILFMNKSSVQPKHENNDHISYAA